MLTVEDAVDPGDPMLWWALREAPALAGMGAPPVGFPFSALSRLGFDAIVSLTGPPSYDPAPLSAHHYALHDLAGGHTPADPQAELAAVARAVEGIRSLRSARCGVGSGRASLATRTPA